MSSTFVRKYLCARAGISSGQIPHLSSPKVYLPPSPQTTTLPLPLKNRKTSTKETLLSLSVPKMASSYSLSDQAADLGIHRVHSLVLGDARREARMARFSPPQIKRAALGRGDARYVEHQIRYEQRRELDRIARRNNLKM